MVEKRESPRADEWREYVVVLRARSSARFTPEGGWVLNLDGVPNMGLDHVRVRCYSRWVQDGPHQLPRELAIEVKGHARSIDEAITKFSTVARPVANMISFVSNVQVGPIEVHLAYDCDADSADRKFLEVFLPDERGAVSEGRFLRQHLLAAACPAFLGLAIDSARVGRALRQYELALRQWYVGGEWLALSHLWMAVEALTKAVIRKRVADQGISEEQYAQSFQLVTDDPQRPRWAQLLGERVREQVIFDGDSETYKAAKAASDGLEHGFLELDKVAAQALKSADRTFHHVRRTVIELLLLPAEVADELMTIKPMDVQSQRKILRGRLLGAAADPAEAGEMYPVLEWRSSIAAVVREGSTFQMKAEEQITARTNPRRDVSTRPYRGRRTSQRRPGARPVQ